MPKSSSDALITAILDVVAGLDLSSTLERIVASAVQLADAKYGALGVIGQDAHLKDFFHYGLEDNQVTMIGHLPQGEGVLGLLIKHPEAIRLADLTQHPASFGFPANHPAMKSFLGVPVRVRGEIFGNLYLTEKQSAVEFSAEDEELVKALAGAAGLAIENSKLSSTIQKVAVFEDRERIARDLHDLVVQQLFATGMTLESISKRVENTDDKQKLSQAVDDLDKTIKQIRQSIYALTSGPGEAIGLRRRVMNELESFSGIFESTPSVTFDGPVDAIITERQSDQVIATLRELLANAAKHAEATNIQVIIKAARNQLSVEVSDDGKGIAYNIKKSGLENLKKRAEQLKGEFYVERRSPKGTRAVWSIPIS
jgi:signal transduction histidine kinase